MTSITDESAAPLSEEARRLLDAARDDGLTVRVMGGIAVYWRCQDNLRLMRSLHREYHDVDIVADPRQVKQLRALFERLGYTENQQVYVDSAGTRIVAFMPTVTTHLDVFLGDLQFCHTIPLKNRLQIDPDTLALADLVLQKLQIFEINRKDLIDLVTLFDTFELGDGDHGVINADRIAGLLAEDWGLWRTATQNLARTREFMAGEHVADVDAERIGVSLDRLADRIEQQPKSMKWRIRSRVGDRVKWYEDVEDLREGEDQPTGYAGGG